MICNFLHISENKNQIFFFGDGCEFWKNVVYKLCAEFARENNNTDNQIDCLYKAIERHEILLRNLNGSSLDEAIQAYTHFCDKKKL